jgi:Gpi18-like mannosyltransferase
VDDGEESAVTFDGAVADTLVAGAAAAVSVALAVLGRPAARALSPLFVFFAYRVVDERVAVGPLPWVGGAVLVGVAAALL